LYGRDVLQEPIEILRRFPEFVSARRAAFKDVLVQLLVLSAVERAQEINLVSFF
jgi:hypothetical protein